ncbi:DNA helicase-2/ATP-dependent DNA helicase PcrA [Planomicrobium sp. HSC-17F08]|nr:DNA helicase-2/ATP-dependent DNA helicase PcrA [Planomicrobium sp. HSC-17F08]
MNPEFQQEQKRVDRVMQEVTGQLRRLEAETSRQKDEVVNIRRHFWDENKVSLDSFDDFLETIIGLRQEAQALSVSESTHRQSAKKLAALRSLQRTPYFGRIDFQEEGEPEKEEVYIGISTLTDSTGDEFLVYDWRAPVSSVYYDHQPGPASYSTPGGEVNGQLEKKWQYLIHGGVLQSMFDTSVTIGDEILQQVLGRSADKKMHSIVATIQQEQNRIIRHDRTRLLIVQGAAGSGKTSAALQRIAYLLYKYRDQLNADQIILFSPNAMFSSYVSNVLPELGEENMHQVTFQEYLNHRLSAQFELENPYGQLEYVLTKMDDPAYAARVAGIRFKASVQFFEAIKSYRRTLEESGMLFKRIRFAGHPIASAEAIEARFYSRDTTLRFHNRLELLKDWLLKELDEFEKQEWEEPWVEEEMELLSNDSYQKAHAYLAAKKGFKGKAVSDYEMEPEELARLVVRQKLKPLRKKIKAYRFVDVKALYRQLFAGFLENNQTELPAEWEAICQQTTDKLADEELFYEDATPFLLLKELILGFQTNTAIRHIVIDEAQDYSPFQFEFLKRLFPAARMTVLGDFNQAIFAHAGEFNDFDVLTNLYGADQTETIRLAQSYRATKPIIEFTRRLVPEGEAIVPFERQGEKPLLTEVGDHTELHRRIMERVAELRGKFGTIAIICKSASEATHAHESLSGIEGLKRLKTGSAEYEQGVIVIPSYLAKGIEFDAVILYDASEQMYGQESLRRLFYTACTRAMHELQLFSVGKPSPFLEEALQEGLVRVEE